MSRSTGVAKGIGAMAAIALLMAAPMALADILYEQAPEDGGGAFLTGAVFAGQEYESHFQYADSFEVTGPGWRLDSISWWGGFSDFNGNGGGVAPFDIRIYADVDGSPSPDETMASFPDVQPVVTATDLIGDLSFGMSQNGQVQYDVQQFTLDLERPLTLDAGRYHLSVNNPGASATFSWLMSASGDSDAWFRAGNPSEWASQEYNLAYNFTGTVIPEPTTMTLLGIGVAGLCARRLRKRKQS